MTSTSERTEWKYRWAPSLGDFEDTPENVWGITSYDPIRHHAHPVVFCGLYGLNDFYALWRHKGKKAIWWTGSDIRHFANGYWLDEKGDFRVPALPLARWIASHCESWVENGVENEKLAEFGIHAFICPSFLGETHQEVSYHPKDRPALYTSVSGDAFEIYGWHRIRELASNNPGVDFHLYGNSLPFYSCDDLHNVFVHGRVPPEQYNEETAGMQGGLRLTEFDGFSEVTARSVLLGQWPVSLIEYPHMLKVSEIGLLKTKTEPNYAGQEYYRKKLNRYPWNTKAR